MARVPLDTAPKGLIARAAAWYSRRRYGTMIAPLQALSHHPGVLWAEARLELSVARRWRKLDPTLQCLAVMAASVRIGCAWCVDFGYWEAHHKGVDQVKIAHVPAWRDSDVYTELERLVLEYAEAMTDTPPDVTDEMVAGLRAHLTDAQLVELTALVGLENLRSRPNAALGLEAQGFRAMCELEPVAAAR
ncbi:MAG: carboxymuconolactone decarboxylase family protein [bacterium]|jgi:AhpD family alkylhydroperoxidase|nr:carboxymuconolactone decarboxylase family protein [bacterium]